MPRRIVRVPNAVNILYFGGCLVKNQLYLVAAYRKRLNEKLIALNIIDSVF